MAEKRQDQDGGARPKGSNWMVPFNSNQSTTNQDLERKFNPAVPQTIQGHYMHNVKNEGDFAGAQIGQVNIQLSVSQVPGIGQQVGGVTGKQEKTGEIWDDLIHNAMDIKLSETSRVSRDSKRYQKLCNLSEKHVRTTLYHEVLDKLDKTDSVTVLGNAGDGKTTLLDLVCVEYGARGYLTIQIDRPDDIVKYQRTDNPVLFICDSFLGRILMDDDKRRSWINCKRDKLTSDKVKLLFACRLQLWREQEEYLHQNPMFQDTVDVRSYKLTTQDKMEMINQHLGDKISERAKRHIAERSNFAFPECCRFVSHSLHVTGFTDTSKLLEIFSNPHKFLTKQLKTIEKKNKLQYATLVFCLFNGSKLPKTCTSDLLKQTNFKEVRKRYLSDKQVGELYDKLLDNAKELDGWLLTHKGNNYTFYHDSIHEGVIRVHGSRYPEDIVRFCEPRLLFLFFTTKQVSGSDSDRVTLSPGCYPQLVEIVTRQCMENPAWYDSETWTFVFKEMQIAEILKEWSQLLKRKMSLKKKISQRLFLRKHTQETLADVLLLITQLPDCKLTVDRVFEYAAVHDDLKTSELLIDSGVTGVGKKRGLYTAAKNGRINIMRMIVERGDLNMIDIEDGLREAICSNRVESVSEIMKLRPDIDTDTVHRVLKWAVERRSVKCVCELLKKGIDKDTIHSLLRTAVDWDSVNCVCELLKRDIDTDTVHSLLEMAVSHDSVNCVCEFLKTDIDTDTKHSLLKLAVGRGHALTVTELLKRLDIGKQTIQSWLDRSELFESWVMQTRRDETCTVLVNHLKNDS